MKKLFVILVAAVFLFGGTASSSSAGSVYGLAGILANAALSQLGYPFGEMTEPPPAELVFVDGFVPTPGDSFTEADVASITVWGDPDRTFPLGELLPGETITGWFSSTDITNGLPEIDLFDWQGDGEVIALDAENNLTWDPNMSGDPLILTDAIFAALGDGPVVDGYTGIQITGTSSNITMNVMAGDTVEFTVDAIDMNSGPMEFRFFVRAGYGEENWGGNKWSIVQPYSANNTVMHTFDVPGIYFLAGHVIHPGDTWAFGWPQSGIVVEVWPAQ
jgi:hypothetical protein